VSAPEELRRSFHDQLAELRSELGDMAVAVVAAVRRASDGFLEGDREVAAELVDANRSIQALYNRVEHDGFDLVALQSPVARDLRFVTASMRIAQELDRCGRLAASIARKAATVSEAALTPAIRAILHELAAESVRMLDSAARAYSVLDIDLALEVQGWDDHVDELHRRLLAALYELENARAQDLVELGLVARFYERLGDHAVKIAERILFVVVPA
jgi:phosphate transport system protein